MIQIFTSKGTPTKRKTSISSDASTFKKTTDTPNAVTVRYTANRNASEFYSHATTKCYSTNSKFKSSSNPRWNSTKTIRNGSHNYKCCNCLINNNTLNPEKAKKHQTPRLRSLPLTTEKGSENCMVRKLAYQFND
ncbi:hypothetical protein M9Y10_020386 [Tritrichomonas musculus]|uniref:Uncharacterized protein n=1 Tax=Tritrichomonas musculus TaxID=1915356 RepID=A0ABR2HG12_9EUKA